MARGGPRTPANPAAVSGPGALSRRTDGKQPMMELPDAQYGEATNFRQIESGAPMQQSPQLRGMSGSSAQGATGPLTPLNAPTTRPNEPVTAGAASGPGPGPDVLGLGSATQGNWQNARDVVTSLASTPTASPALQALAARLQGAY